MRHSFHPSAAPMAACLMCFALVLLWSATATAAPMLAGVGKADITDREAGPVSDTLYAKALVLKDDRTTLVLITVDAVAIGEIGHIGNAYLGQVRAQLQKELNIDPAGVLINASHCHGVVHRDVTARTVQAVKDAVKQLTPVKIGAGLGYENRIMENRRLRLKDGSEADVRHAYALPPDEKIAGIGPVDPQIGLLRIDRMDGRPLAVVYNFACHPIQGVPGKGNTADFPGFASRVIEENLGEGVMALFVQGCAGDINPVRYKDTRHPRDAEPLGNLLGLSALKAIRKIVTKDGGELKLLRETLALPRSTDGKERIAALEAEQKKLLDSLKGTSLNFKNFMSLYMQYKLGGEFPSYDAGLYLHEKSQQREDLVRLDQENKANMEAYIQNIHTMEALTRVQTNLALLRKHEARNAAAVEAGATTLDVEIAAVKIGDFVLATFPGELTVQIGLNIKKRAASEFTFVAGYTNGYIYYAPTAEQRKNTGHAQEDCDCLVAPQWQKAFEDRMEIMLKKLANP